MMNILLSLIIILAINGCALVKSYDPHYGKVIDLTTRQPIQGAAVLAIYNTSGLIDHTEHIDAVEVITDEKGNFMIPRNTLLSFQLFSGWDPLPQIFIYKPGYGCFPKYKKEKVLKDVDATDVRASHAVPDYSLPSDTPLTIELEHLTNEERRQYSECDTYNIPYKKMREMKKLEYMERINLGLENPDPLFISQPDLYMAITYDDYKMTKRLIEAGLDINLGPHTPLMFAAQLGRSEMASILIKSGAYIDAQNAMGQTPLTIALHLSQRQTAILLINKNANVNIAEKFGATPLSIACGEGYFDIVELLLQKGASVSVRGDNGRAVLAITKRVAKGSESDRMIKLLRSYGARD